MPQSRGVCSIVNKAFSLLEPCYHDDTRSLIIITDERCVSDAEWYWKWKSSFADDKCISEYSRWRDTVVIVTSYQIIPYQHIFHGKNCLLKQQCHFDKKNRIHYDLQHILHSFSINVNANNGKKKKIYSLQELSRINQILFVICIIFLKASTCPFQY